METGLRRTCRLRQQITPPEKEPRHCSTLQLRNIQEYTPESSHAELWRRMKKIMALSDHRLAEREFHSLANWLSTLSHEAEKSLREAGAELLTVHKLGLKGLLRNSLSSTNIIESLIGVVKVKIRNVRNWNYHPKTSNQVPRDKALRWVAMALEAHRPKMKRLRGGKDQMQTLINNLNLLDTNQEAA